MLWFLLKPTTSLHSRSCADQAWWVESTKRSRSPQRNAEKLSFGKLQWAFIKQQNCRGTDRSLQTCLKNAAEKKKLVLSISQLPALLVLVFFSAAFSAVKVEVLCCGTKSGTKANINLDREFDLAESQARLPNSQQTSPRFAEAPLGWLLAQLTNRELHSTPPRVTRPALRWGTTCPSLGLCCIISTGDLQQGAGEHLMAFTREYTQAPDC